MKKLQAVALSLLVMTINLEVGRAQVSGQGRGPRARKFDELTIGLGSPRSWWVSNIKEQDEEMKARLVRYARQLRREGARAYIIGYSPRVIEWYARMMERPAVMATLAIPRPDRGEPKNRAPGPTG